MNLLVWVVEREVFEKSYGTVIGIAQHRRSGYRREIYIHIDIVPLLFRDVSYGNTM